MLKIKNKSGLISLFCGVFLLSGSCVWDWGSLGQTDPAAIVQESNLADSVREKTEGDGRRGRRSGGSSRSYKCRNDNNCASICEDLFDDTGVVENCLELSTSKVEGRGTKRNRGFEYILDVFDAKITYPALTNIDGNSFGALMKLSVEHWVNLTDDVTEQEAKALLAWIASDKEVAKVVREHGVDGNYAGFNSYEGFIRLMKEVGNRTGCDEFKDALVTQHLAGRFTFCCIAWREKNIMAASVFAAVPPTPNSSDIIGDLNTLEDCGTDAVVCPVAGGDSCPPGSS